MNMHFTEETLQMANKSLKRCSNLITLVVREIQVKSQRDTILHLLGLAKVKTSDNTKR